MAMLANCKRLAEGTGNRNGRLVWEKNGVYPSINQPLGKPKTSLTPAFCVSTIMIAYVRWCPIVSQSAIKTNTTRVYGRYIIGVHKQIQ